MRALILALALMFALPLTGSASEPGVRDRCRALTAELNAYRSPDVALKWLLCDIAHERSVAQARAGYGFHDIGYVVRRLQGWGGCWRSVGEAIAWTGWPPSAERFIRMWRNSPTHWSLLSASAYDRAGGTWVTASGGRTYATVLVLNEC